MAQVENFFVTKRNGNLEKLDINKFHKVVMWACEGLQGVYPSEIELKSQIQFYNKIKTREIQETLIKAAAELISEKNPNYQYVASRLINYNLRKEIYNSITPPHLFDHYKSVVEKEFYSSELFDLYTKEEFDIIDEFIDHNRDYLISYAGMEQFCEKYLVKNRVTNVIHETPQFAFVLIGMFLFSKYPKEKRLEYVKKFYDATSKFKLSLPSPIIAGVRTKQKQFSSCVLIETDDSLDSINATASSIVKYVSQKAGIGIGAGKIRALNSPIRKGEAYHTGVIPFFRYFQSAVKSTNQGSIRGGSATLYFPFFHLEIESVLVLKNNRGTEETRLRQIDYGIQFNKLFYERVLNDEKITLFSPSDVPGLYDAFFRNDDEFKEIYEKAEKNPNIRKKTISALELFSLFIQERKETGRIYLMNVDNVNNQGSFIREISPVKMSNLCTEITLPTTPLKHIFDEEGEIALCTLSALNVGAIKNSKEMEMVCDIAVRALDELLDYQNYPVLAGKIGAEKRRSLGIGVTNFAYWLAKNDLKYSDIDREGLSKIHELFEEISYNLINSSIELAKEKGHCEFYDRTKYSLGILPIDTYKKTVDELVDPVYKKDWNGLRERLKKYGIRNSTLMAIMPCESSSLVSNSTNGIEPPREFVSYKTSKNGVLKQVVPEIQRLKNKYDLLWNQKSPEGYLKICSVIQKFVDQAISVNTSYNPKFYENEEIPLSLLLKHIIMFYRYGGKCLYYFNTNDGAGELEENKQRSEKTEELEEDCESCKI